MREGDGDTYCWEFLTLNNVQEFGNEVQAVILSGLKKVLDQAGGGRVVGEEAGLDLVMQRRGGLQFDDIGPEVVTG